MELQKLNTKWKGKNNMALELVTGYKGQNHVTADQWADFNRSIYGTAAILPVGNKMAVEIQTANQITVKDGVAVFDGRQIYIGYGESENVAIESGTQAMLRNDIVVVKYTKNEETGVESVAFEVITGVPAVSDPVDPSYQDMDIRTGVFTSQKAFCRVRLNGVAIEGIDMLVDVKEINDHAFAAPANNLTTATPGTALDAAMGKKLQEEYDQLNGDIASLTEKTEWAHVSFVGAVDVTSSIPNTKCARVPSTAEEICVEITAKRNASTTIKFSQYLKTPGAYNGGYYNSDKYYASYQLGYSNNIIYLNKSWLKVVDNGTEYNNADTVQVDVYYR